MQEDWWTTDTPRALRSPSGRLYATVTGASRVTLSTDGGATIELETHGLRLRTTPGPTDLPVYVARELVFAGVLKVGRATALRWTASTGPHLRVGPPADPRVRFVRRPEAEVACTDLRLTPEYTDLVVPEHSMRGRGPIAVAASPGGPTVLTLATRGSLAVKLLERSGPHAHIAWPIADRALADATVIGWVDGRLVGPPAPLIEGSFSSAGLGMTGSSDWGGCTAEHPLFADAGRGPERVGELLVGTRVQPGRRRGTLTEVTIIGPSVRQDPPPVKPRTGARFLLAPADATDCAR